MRQSSADEATPGREQAEGAFSDRTGEREQSFLLYAGLAGAALLTAGLWIARALIARATSLELIAGVMTLIGAGAVLSVLTTLLLLATRVDRASEEVSSVLDAVAAGKLTGRLEPPRGLGREARLAGAAAAALDRLRGWIDASRSAVTAIEKNLATTSAAVPHLRESLLSNSGHVQQLTRDSQFLGSGAEEQAGLTQRACVLASVIGQSHRDTSAFAERIHTSVRDASSSLTECATRIAELRAAVAKQEEESTNCLEADRQLAEYLVLVSKSARQFKLLALHAAMEAARAGAQSESQGASGNEHGRGAEFRVVALEVRRLSVDLAKATEDIARSVEGSRRSMQALHAGSATGGRHIDAAHSAISLGATALDHATAAASARRADDATLAEAGTELTILTSAIRERSAGSAKGIGDLADRLSVLDQSLAAADASAREIEQALSSVGASVAGARDTIGAMLTSTPDPTPAAAVLPSRAPRKKRARGARHVSPPAGAKA